MKMWILAGRNKLYAKQNRMEANDLADEVLACIKADKEYVKDYHEIDDGAFYGFGLSKHIGFRDENWNDENCQYPLRTYAYPADEPRMIVAKKNDEHYLTGGFWCERPLVWRDAMRKDVSEIAFEIACGSEKKSNMKFTRIARGFIFLKNREQLLRQNISRLQLTNRS